jgi:hypothetical protein
MLFLQRQRIIFEKAKEKMKKYGKKSVPLQPILLIMYINNIKLWQRKHYS